MAADGAGALRELTALAGFGADEVAALAASLEPFALAPGEWLYHQNDPALGLHVVAKGRIAVQGRTLADRLVELAEIGAGDLVGEFALIDQGRRSAAAQALEATEGWFLPREQFERLVFVGDPAALGLARHIRRLAAARTRGTLANLTAEPQPAGELRASGEGAVEPSGRTPDELAAMLRGLHQFRDVSPAEAAALVGAAEAIDAARGAVLTAAGAPADGLRIVLRGALRLSLARDGGLEQLLIHGPGKIAGAGPAVDGEPHAAGLDAREDALVLHVGQRQAEAWLGGAGGLGGKLAELVARQLTADLRALSRLQGRRHSMALLNERS
jgi:CRP-like cAMP-binding protein